MADVSTREGRCDLMAKVEGLSLHDLGADLCMEVAHNPPTYALA